MKQIFVLPDTLEQSLLKPGTKVGSDVPGCESPRKDSWVPSWKLTATHPSELSLAFSPALWNIVWCPFIYWIS